MRIRLPGYGWSFSGSMIAVFLVAGASCGEPARDTASKQESKTVIPDPNTIAPIPNFASSPAFSNSHSTAGPANMPVFGLLPKSGMHDDCPKAAAAQRELDELRLSVTDDHSRAIILQQLIAAALAECANQIPEGWIPRSFDGQAYYFQPLV